MAAGFLLTLIFLVLSALHWIWAVRGLAEPSPVIPEVEGKPAFRPGRGATALVALLLLLAAGLCATQAELFGLDRLPGNRLAVWVLLAVFLLRSIGDFRLVGWFKSERSSRFARLDTWVFSPLCLIVAGLCVLLLHATR